MKHTASLLVSYLFGWRHRARSEENGKPSDVEVKTTTK
jgi:hypothetical protein